MESDLQQYLRTELIVKKMNSPLGYVIMIFCAALLAILVTTGGYWVGPAVIAVLTGIILITITIIFPLIGYYMMMIMGFFAFYPDRIVGVHLGIPVAVEFMILAVYLGMLAKSRKTQVKDKLFYKSPTTIGMMFFFLFVLIEGFNPNMRSLVGWLFYVRRYFEFLIIYYMTYKLIDTREKVRYLARFWVFMTLLTALYTCKQQWFGFFGFEDRWLHSDPHLIALYFQGGEYRKFSFLSDPAQAGILLASMSVFAIILAMGEPNRKRRWYMLGSGFIMMMAMGYTGTRTATFIILVGVIFYILMTLDQKRTLYFIGYCIVFIVIIMWGPIHNQTIYRIRSTFRGSTDQSLQVRNINRKNIQPYIYAHPLGGGLATSSTEGLNYNPGHYLAGFPPDSGFLKSAIETGWIGYAIALLNYYLIVILGVRCYFRARDPEFKLYLLAFTIGIAIFITAQYAQVAIGQFPGLFFFYPAAAILIRLKQLDEVTVNQEIAKINS